MNRRHTTFSLALILAILTFTLVAHVGALSVSAQVNNEPDTRFTMSPIDGTNGYFDLTLSPGETTEIQFNVSNTGAVNGNALLYVADVSTRVNGGVAAGLAGEAVNGPGQWIRDFTETVQVEAGASIIKSVSITVPEDVAPGEHITSFVVQAADSGSDADADAGVSMKMVSRQALPVLITVPGTVAPALELGTAELVEAGGDSIVTFTANNSGNVRLKTTGEFTIANNAGKELARSSVTYSSIYAGDTATLEAPLEFALEPGDYTVSLWLEDSVHGVRSETGPLALNVPVPAPAAEPVNPSTTDPVTQTESAIQPVVETQVVGIPTWALLISIPVAIVAGVVLAFAMMKRRMQPVPMPASAQPRMVVRESPPAVTNKRVPVRQIVPPGRRGENA